MVNYKYKIEFRGVNMKIRPYDFKPIGMRIKQMRKLRHFTQEQLAEIIDMSQKNLSMVERGAAGLSISSLMSICKALQTSADYILFGISASNSNNALVEMLSHLDEKQQTYAEEMLSVYVKALTAED